ncbi:hypothetical protein [Candidatus Soleaferrea massiliensis]|uniref:hypothetical protein n=1 Tax=Candidatus Soleaferrea massiliensis TaxID=1470354 RepID=UPI000693316B|nr:hypothetical protein [Candidatus Soleaferrea massiliensis]
MTEKTNPIWRTIKPVFAIVILAVCTVMLFYGLKETEIELSDNQIQMKGMYGMNIDFTDVENITLLEKSMREIGIGTRTNGFGGFGSTLKGNFESERLGKYKLFVDADSSPTILIERTHDVDVYISFQDSQKTEDYFSELSKVTAE